MNLYVAICLLAVTASANADGALGLGGLGGLVYAPGHASADYYAYPRYAFEYSVKDPHTGDNKAQWEKRDGDVVKGAYSLVEPDGSLRIVEYSADDKTGFNAVVKRVGPNLHPPTVHAAPIYKAPIPVLGHGPVLSPISVGPVANLGHLASAPLISGPIHGPVHGPIHSPALSTQNLIREPVSIIKPILPAPILHEPILPIVKTPILPVPILREPILKGPLLPNPYLHEPILRGPIGHGPLLNEPIIKGPISLLPTPILPRPILNEPYLRGPILSEPILREPILKGLPGPIYKSGPLYSEPLGPLPIYKAPLPLIKEQIPLYREPLPALPLLRGPLGPWEGLGKGPITSLDWEGRGIGPVHGGPRGYLERGLGWNRPLEYPLH